MRYHFFSLFVLLLCLPLLTFGQVDADSVSSTNFDSIQQLSHVEVTANRYKEVIPSQRLNGAQLEVLSSFSVADAIRYFSGVQIKDYGGVGGIKTVDIRSMGTNHMGVFYDGIPLGNAQNGQIDLGKFSLDNIEEISLYNGQKSEIFQSAKDFGSAGTIYLRSRSPKFDKGKNTNLKVIMRSGSFHLGNPSILWEQKLTKNISTSLNAEYLYSSGKYKFRYRRMLPNGSVAWDTTAIRQNGDINALRIESAIRGNLSEGYWNAKLYYYNSQRGIPGAIVNNVWKNSQRQWDKNLFIQGSYQKAFTPKYNFQFNAKYANDYMRYLNPDTTLLYIDNTFRQQELYLSTANKYTIQRQWEIAFSVDYQFNKLDASLRDFVHPHRHTLLASLATAIELWHIKMQGSLLGTFISDNATRQEYSSSTDKHIGQTEQNSFNYEYTPALFASYKPFNDQPLLVRFFYKKIFRMPTFNDLYYTDIGNASLNPEYTTQYNIGFVYSKLFKHRFFSSIDLRADGYYNQVTDKIVAIPKGNGQYRWMMMNIGLVEIRGIDFSLQTAAHINNKVHFHLGMTYTYQKAQDFSDPTDTDPKFGTYGKQIAYIPWHSGSIIFRTIYKTWDLNYSFIYVGERYHNSANIPANHEQPWYTHDLTLSKQFYFDKKNLSISAEINNLFNQYYDVILNYPMPGRNFKIILKLDI